MNYKSVHLELILWMDMVTRQDAIAVDVEFAISPRVFADAFTGFMELTANIRLPYFKNKYQPCVHVYYS